MKMIDMAKEFCKNINIHIIDHFADAGKMVMADKEVEIKTSWLVLLSNW